MRLFVVFRTFDRIWSCKTYTRELAPFEMDMSKGPIKLMFMVDLIVADPDGHEFALQHSNFLAKISDFSRDSISFYCLPHRSFFPKIVTHRVKDQDVVAPVNGNRNRLRRFSVPSLELDVPSPFNVSEGCSDVIYFVLPMYRCTVLLDAHLASCISSEYSRSRVFRRHFWHFLKNQKGFRNCIPDYEAWTQEERDAWDMYLTVPFMIDLVAVWPKQKIDYAWNNRILALLNKHIVLAEGFAWLSTLGGAHSSLGETFRYHAEKAGEISAKQLRLAIELGNESLIARCYLFWSWSLLQKGELRRCKACVLNTWKFSQRIQCRDWMLENMCKAVWSRLKYKRALRREKRKCDKMIKNCDFSDNNRGGGDSGDFGKKNPHDRTSWDPNGNEGNKTTCVTPPLCGNSGPLALSRKVAAVRVV